MRKALLLSLLAFSTFGLQAEITETAKDAVKNMGLGWNLGNTLDANSGKGKDITDASYWGQQDLSSETCWGQPTTKKELITMMKEAGVGAIRVPVTWYNHMDKDGKVDAAWMKRVHEVVDYVIDEGLYCIINVHHDTGADSNDFMHWIHADEANYTQNKDKFEYLWKQIAEEFKDYDKKLLFEGYNEMLDAKSTWNAPVNSNSYNAINNYAQSFVDAVRATGGNNATRNLIVNTYAAANNDAPVKNLKLPTDKAKDHTIVEVHAYPNFFTWSNNPTLRTIKQVKDDVDYIAKNLKNQLISKGIPAIIGEWGSYGVDNGAGKTDYDLRKDMFLEFCDYFVTKMKSNDIATFYWMGLSDGPYRSMPAFNQPDLAECVAKAYHGSTFQGKYPEPAKTTSYDLVKEPMTFLNWGEPRLSIPATYFKTVGENVQLTLTYTFTGDDEDIQFFYGDWSSKPDFMVGETSYEGDYFPHVDHNGTDPVTTVFTFSKKTAASLASAGLIIFGHNFTVTKAVLADSSAASIEQLETVEASDAIYSLFGQRLVNASQGIYIQSGRKIMVK